MPPPVAAEIAYVSSQPSAWNSAALELALLVVGLVGGHDDRLRRPAQELRRLLVGGGQADRGVDHEQDHVRLGDREARLVLDLRLDRVVGSISRPPVSTTTNRRPFHSASP